MHSQFCFNTETETIVLGENRPELEPQSTDGFQCVIFILM